MTFKSNLFFTVMVLVALAAFVPVPLTLADIERLCDHKRCVLVNSSLITKTYPGLFHTEDEIDILLDRWRLKHDIYRPAPGSLVHKICSVSLFESMAICLNLELPPKTSPPLNYDLCCPMSLDTYQADTLDNIHGRTQILVSVKNKTQFIPDAQCILNNGACFSRMGKCQTDTVEFPLLVVDTSRDPPFCRFDIFELPVYCSCKASK